MLQSAAREVAIDNPELAAQIKDAQMYALNWIKLHLDELPPTAESMQAVASVLSVLNACDISADSFPAIHGHSQALR